MSLYTFAATSLTTSADCKRRAAVTAGQIARTLALFLLVLAASTLVKQHIRAEANAPQVAISTVSR